MTTKVYASGIAGRIGALVVGIIAVPLAAIALPLVLLKNILGVRDSKILIAVCVGILVIGAIWVLVHVFVTGPIRIETDARSVRLRQGLRVTNEWQRASTVFGSLVTRQSTNGIPTGSLRKVFATTELERTEVPARWFSAATFNDLMADLAPVAAMGGGAGAAASGGALAGGAAAVSGAPSDQPRTFTLDARASRLRGPVRSVVTVLVVGFFVSIAIIGYFLVVDVTSDAEALIFFFAIAIFVLVVVLVAMLAGRRRIARIPKSISVTGSTLQIDDQTLYWGQLASIEITPPSYSGNQRRLTLVEKIGTRTSYQLGTAAARGPQVFADYDDFVDTLGRVAPTGVVRFDLR